MDIEFQVESSNFSIGSLIGISDLAGVVDTHESIEMIMSHLVEG